MITISLMVVAKVIGLFMFAPFAAFLILYPINDKPTSKAQWYVYIAVMTIAVDVLFVHIFPFTIRFTM